MASEKVLCEFFSPIQSISQSQMTTFSPFPFHISPVGQCNVADHQERAVGESGGIAPRASQNIPIIADPWVSDRARKTLDQVIHGCLFLSNMAIDPLADHFVTTD